MNPISAIRISISGHQIECDGVLMHSAPSVMKWQKLLAQAQPLLGSFSSGISIWGSPGVALAGAAAIGFLEAAVTGGNQKEGLKLLAEATALHERLRPRGVYVPVEEIANVISPETSIWTARGTVESELDVRTAERTKWSFLMREYNASEEEIESGFIVREKDQELVVLPDSFVACRSGERYFLIKWSSVDMFEAIRA